MRSEHFSYLLDEAFWTSPTVSMTTLLLNLCLLKKDFLKYKYSMSILVKDEKKMCYSRNHLRGIRIRGTFTSRKPNPLGKPFTTQQIWRKGNTCQKRVTFLHKCISTHAIYKQLSVRQVHQLVGWSLSTDAAASDTFEWGFPRGAQGRHYLHELLSATLL